MFLTIHTQYKRKTHREMKCKMQMMCEVLDLSSLIHETTLVYLLRLRFQFSNCIFTLTSITLWRFTMNLL